MKRKMIFLFLCVVLLSSVIVIPINAQETVLPITLSNAFPVEGKTLIYDIPFDIDLSGARGVDLNIRLNSNLVEKAEMIDPAQSISEAMVVPNQNGDKFKIAIASSEPITHTGRLFTLRLQLKREAAPADEICKLLQIKINERITWQASDRILLTGVTDGKIYKSSITITFNEGSATLNGVAFQSGGTVEAEGEYTLVVTDTGGDVRRVHFYIGMPEGHVHSYGDWEENLTPDCTNKGEESRICSACDHVDTREVDALGHNYSHTIEGDTVTYVCQRCDDTYQKPLSEVEIPLVNTAFDTAWGMDFTTTVSTEMIIKAGVSFKLVYDRQTVSLKNLSANSLLTVDSSVDGVISICTGEDIEAGADLLELTFTTSDYLVSKDYEFLTIAGNEFVKGNFTDLTIYEMGDVNMDGKVSAKDVMLIKQHSVKMIELTDVQKAYANTYVDYDANGGDNISARDALLIQQSIVKMDVDLGDRVEVTFVYDDETEEKRTVHAGEALELVPQVPEGMAWSESDTEYVPADFSAITEEKRYYLVRKENN
jgi:hypothetical protein